MSRVGTAHQFFNGWSTNEWWAVPTLPIDHHSMLALLTFATVTMVVEVVLVVVFIVAVDGHTNQPDQRIDVERRLFLAGRVF